MSQATLGSEPFQNSNLFSSYYLSDRIDDLDEWECDEAAEDAFERLQNLWELEADIVAGYKEDELLDTWIDKVIEVLGFDSLSETTLPNSGGYTDRLLFESAETRRDGAAQKNDGDQAAMFGLASAILEAKQWDADFTTRFAEERKYRDASHQIKYYLEHTPERLQWGILTNGRKWRLYGTKDYATEIYYEVDLPELLESGIWSGSNTFMPFSGARRSARLPGPRSSIRSGPKAKLPPSSWVRTSRTTSLRPCGCSARALSRPTTSISIPRMPQPARNSKSSRWCCCIG